MSIESRSRQYGKVFDHWQIKEFLGSGSGGKTAVFRLVRSDSGWGVSALKVINLIEERGDISALSDYRRREYEYARDECSRNAEQEVRLMDDLRGNTNIVDYLDHTFVDWSDEVGFGRDLLIRMELLNDLRSELRSGKVFSEVEVLKIGRDICAALIRCHRKNILHRDVKPENIFRNKDGDYKLGDFGVSRVLDACPGAVASTGIGTYEYWPAEQMTGRYDKRVDIYSLGLVLYELSNQNRLPFAASTYVTGREVSMRLSGIPLPRPSDASNALSEVILKACAFDPGDRYQSAEELMKALNGVIRSIHASAAHKTVVQPEKSVPNSDDYTTVPVSAAKRVPKRTGGEYKTAPASADEHRKRGTFETQPARKSTSYKTMPAEHVNQTVPAGSMYQTGKTGRKRSKKSNPLLVVLLTVACMLAILLGGFLANILLRSEGYDSVMSTSQATTENDNYTHTVAKESTAATEIATESPTESQAVTEATTVATTAPQTEEVINFLLVGDHSKETPSSRLANTAMILTVNTYTKTLTITSILHDTYLKLPDYMGHVCGKNRFSVCYHLGYTWGDAGGAMEMTNLCVADNFGVNIDHNIEVDFDGFVDIIDQLGGLAVRLTEQEAIALSQKGYFLQAGDVTLNGEEALAYARLRENRYSVSDTSRQRYVLETLYESIRNLSVTELQDLADQLIPLVTTNMTAAEITDFLIKILPVVSELTIQSGTCPTGGTYWGETVDLFGVTSSVIVYDKESTIKEMKAITEYDELN